MEAQNRGAADRVALVTGGSGGIGRAVAERLAHDGMAVAVHYAGNVARATEVVETITAGGGQAMVVGGDVADEHIMAEVFDAVEQRFDGIDVVVHTAGQMVLDSLVDIDFTSLDGMIRTNVRGTFVVDQLAARRVREGGAIINFSTSVTKAAMPSYAGYAATKGAVDAISLILARELRGRDITVNAVAPGPTATPLFFEGKSQELVGTIANANPMQRLGTPEDIAEVVAFLAGPARWINGQVIYVNGGMV
jgi:3-oxoacyl-[acyl-carrier protein] reductase